MSITIWYFIFKNCVCNNIFCKVDRTPLHMAAQHGHTHVVELLISSGACANNADMVCNLYNMHVL